MSRRTFGSTARLRGSVAAAAAAVCLLVADCSTDEPDDEVPPSATAGTTAPSASADDPTEDVEGLEPATGGLPTEFDRAREVVLPDEQVLEVAAPPGAVLTMTAEQLLARSLPTLESAYALAPDDGGAYVDLFVDEADGAGYLLAMRNDQSGGTSVGSDTYQVTGFDLTDGATTQTATGTVSKRATGSAQGAVGRIVDVVDGVVVVSSSVPDTLAPPTAVALDLASGDLSWTRASTSVLAAAPGVVVAGTGTQADPGQVLGLDAATGRVRWRTADPSISATVLGIQGSVVSVAATDAIFRASSVTRVSLRSGKPVRGAAREVDTAVYGCSDAGPGRVVCSVGDGSVVEGWDLRRNRPTWTLPTADRFAPRVSTVEGGYVYGYLDDTTGVVLDAETGADVASSPGVSPLDVNEYGGVTLFMGVAVFTPQGPDSSAE